VKASVEMEQLVTSKRRRGRQQFACDRSAGSPQKLPPTQL
jgi:hypothetical protein